jgi:hypothetical protein
MDAIKMTDNDYLADAVFDADKTIKYNVSVEDPEKLKKFQ